MSGQSAAPIRAFGHRRNQPDGDDRPIELSEVTFVASPAALRRIAQHLHEAAAALERHGPAFGHAHLQDAWDGWTSADVDVIVASG